MDAIFKVMNMKLLISFVLFFFVLVLLIGCGGNTHKAPVKSVSVSVIPQKYFVDQITGGEVEVNVLVAPGASPATYEPTPKQMRQMQYAAAYLQIGYIGFEKAWIPKILPGPPFRVFDLSEGCNLIHSGAHKHGDHVHYAGVDPHLWVAPQSVRIIAKNTLQALLEIYPGKDQEYRENHRVFDAHLQHVDSLLRVKLEPLQGKSFLIFHPALTYLARDYGLIQIPVELDGKSPSASHMKNLIDHAKQLGIKNIVVQAQFDIDQAQTIATEVGGHVIVVDPLAENWSDNILRIADQLVAGYGE